MCVCVYKPVASSPSLFAAFFTWRVALLNAVGSRSWKAFVVKCCLGPSFKKTSLVVSSARLRRPTIFIARPDLAVHSYSQHRLRGLDALPVCSFL